MSKTDFMNEVNIEMSKISDLGTVNGLKRLAELLGSDYIYPKISFFTLEEGMFREEDSHFVLYNSAINWDENRISFINEKRYTEIVYDNPLDSKYFHGNKTGFVNHGTGSVTCYIEFTTESYFVDVMFYEADLHERLKDVILAKEAAQ